MTQDEMKVWNILKKHVGRDNSISKANIQMATSLDERVVRDVMRTLRIVHGKLVCYTQSWPGGYFLAATIDELKVCRDIEASREQSVRENRQFYDSAMSAAGSTQKSMF